MEDEAGRWMTFAELRRARGTTKRAAVMLVRRHRWRKQPNNAGHVIALVPPTWAEPAAEDVTGHNGSNGEGHSAGHSIAFHTHALALLEQSLSALREAHAAEATGLREQLADAGARADRLERDLSAALMAADAVRADARAAQAKVDELRQAEEARKGQGRWARLREAWRGE